MSKTLIKRCVSEVSLRSNFSLLLPSNIALAPTNRCNSKCLTCAHWKTPSLENELDTGAWQTIIAKIRRWYGPFHFTLSGGEPLLRSDICDLIAYAASTGCYASLITNGLLLTDRRIDSLINAGLERLTISLNGINADTHDFTRGVSGAFEKIHRAVSALQNWNEKLSISVATTVMGYNCHELVELVQWVTEQKFCGIKFQTLFFETGNRDYQEKWYDQSVLWYPRTGSFSETIQELIDLKKKGAPILNSETQLNYFIKYFEIHKC